MSYQAVIRNSSNALVVSKVIGMKISILQGSTAGTAVYVETQTPTSNANGLVTLEIGGGTVVSGNLASIDWANGPYFIKTETDPTGGTSYTITGTSQLLSVPYALHAKTAENGFSGNYDDLLNIPEIPSAISQLLNDAGYLTTEADGSVTNELQALSISNDTIYLSNGGFVKLPAGFD
ncbi:Legionella vir region protein, partial [sediment metagenome]